MAWRYHDNIIVSHLVQSQGEMDKLSPILEGIELEFISDNWSQFKKYYGELDFNHFEEQWFRTFRLNLRKYQSTFGDNIYFYPLGKLGELVENPGTDTTGLQRYLEFLHCKLKGVDLSMYPPAFISFYFVD